MKREDLLKIFGTEYPLVKDYLNWITENNPESLQPWNPSLDSQIKVFLSDSEFIELCKNFKPTAHYSGAAVIRYENDWKQLSEKVVLLLRSFQKIKKENFSSWNEIFEAISDLEKIKWDRLGLQMAEETREHVKTTLELISERNGILVNRLLEKLEKELEEKKQKLREKKGEVIENLKKINHSPKRGELFTREEYDSIRNSIISNANYDLRKPERDNLLGELFTREEYDSIRKIILRNTVEDMRKNPQDWKIFKSSGITLPWSGNMSYAERKDGRMTLYETSFSKQEWKEIEKTLGKNFFFELLQSYR